MKNINNLKTDKNFQDILKKHKVQKISAFGSFAKNLMHEKSDIDFLVEFERTADLLDMVGLKLDLENLFQRKAEIVTPASLNKYIRKRILQEAVPIYG
jgi:predicted nucleotidyltransferase